MFLLAFPVLLRAEGNHRQKLFNLREHPLLDDFPDLFVARPVRILAAVVRPRPQSKLDDLVAEIFRIGDPGGLLDLCKLLIEKFAIQKLTGILILEILIFDPGVGVVDVAIKQVLAIVGIGF